MDSWMNGIEHQEINPCIYGQLILAKNTQWKQAKCPSMDKGSRKHGVCVCVCVCVCLYLYMHIHMNITWPHKRKFCHL